MQTAGLPGKPTAALGPMPRGHPSLSPHLRARSPFAEPLFSARGSESSFPFAGALHQLVPPLGMLLSKHLPWQTLLTFQVSDTQFQPCSLDEVFLPVTCLISSQQFFLMFIRGKAGKGRGRERRPWREK